MALRNGLSWAGANGGWDESSIMERNPLYNNGLDCLIESHQVAPPEPKSMCFVKLLSFGHFY